ncbi:hypothetical protein AVEN_82936-1 [Araneus ventricosus]|uniref:Uncharacterized protein n=1 Tax=Araneus ventricosus TaxID=182803 RepID=A0A4Y2CUV8_ARAVE|nr:hypothetical protein AVEN_82936-1 [Araneus ventricosus]
MCPLNLTPQYKNVEKVKCPLNLTPQHKNVEKVMCSLNLTPQHKNVEKETILVKSEAQLEKEVLHNLPHLFISHFLFTIITGDETWVHNFTPDTKSASMTWKHPSSPVTKGVSHSAGKVVLTVFWDAEDVILIDWDH